MVEHKIVRLRYGTVLRQIPPYTAREMYSKNRDVYIISSDAGVYEDNGFNFTPMKRLRGDFDTASRRYVEREGRTSSARARYYELIEWDDRDNLIY